MAKKKPPKSEATAPPSEWTVTTRVVLGSGLMNRLAKPPAPVRPTQKDEEPAKK